MKKTAVAVALCLVGAASRKPSRETASDRIEKLLAARGGKKSADRRWTRGLSGDDECTYYYDDNYCPNCPTQYSAYMTCIDGTYGDDDGDGGDDDGDDDGRIL